MSNASQESNSSSTEGPVRVVGIVLFMLLMLNALLYYKLWALEDKVLVQPSSFNTIDPSILRQVKVCQLFIS